MVKLIEVGSKEFNDLLKEVAQEAARVAIEQVKDMLHPEYIDKEAAMKMIGCKETTLYNLTVNGAVKTARIGKENRYYTQSIIDYLKKKKP